MATAKKTILGFEQRTFVALVAFVLCGGGAAFALYKPEKGVRPEERAYARFESKDVDRLEITTNGKTSTFEKDGESWKVTAPVKDKADQTAVSSVADRLATVRFEGIVADKQTSQASYEVTPDKGAHVVARHGSQTLCDIYVGKQDGKLSYLRNSNGAEIYAVDGLARWDVQKEPVGWRDHTIFPLYKSEEVAQIEVDTPAGNTVLKKEPGAKGAAPQPAYEAKWDIAESPIKDKLATIDTSVAPGIATTLVGLHASDIVDDVKPEQAGLAPKPDGVVTLTMQDGTKYTLDVGAAKDTSRYVMTPGDARVFVVPQTTLERVYVTPQQFRPKDMADVKADDVTGIDITSGGEETSLAKDGTDWKATKPAGLTVDGTKVTPVAGALDNLKAVLFADESDPKITGLDKPATVAVFHEKDGASVTLSIGGTKGTSYNYASVSTHPGDVFLISSYTASRVAKKPSDLGKEGASAPAVASKAGRPPAKAAHKLAPAAAKK